MESILFYCYSASGKSTTLFRFYSDGIVVRALVSNQLQDFEKVIVWLKKNSEKSSVTFGKYYKKGKEIEIVFTNKSESRYSGEFEDGQIKLFRVSSSFAKKYSSDLSPFGNAMQFKWNEQKLFSPYHYRVNKIPPPINFKAIEPFKLKNSEPQKPFSFLEEFEKMAKESDRQENIRLTNRINERKAQEAKRIEQEKRRKEEERNSLYKLVAIAGLVLFIVFVFSMCTRQRVGCHCWDGTESSATGSGACSWHRGVMYWKHKYWWEKD